MSEHNAQVSVLKATVPKRLAKQFRLNSKGELIKEKAGDLVRGHYERHTVAGVQGLAEIVQSLKPNQALCFGVAAPESSPIASRDAARDGDITRTRDCFDWPGGPGFLFLDYDPSATGEALTPDALYETLQSVCPALGRAPIATGVSGSSWIFNRETNERLRGSRGLRMWVNVADCRDIPRAGRVLFDRLWLAGRGYYGVSKSGALLERGLVDLTMWQPERLDFASGASCVPPLEQRRPEPGTINPDAEPLDTSTALPDLNEAERAQLADAKKASREAVADEQQAARQAWLAARLADFEQKAAKQLASLDDDEREQRVESAHRTLVAAVTKSQLFGDFELLHSSGRTVTVGELLDKPEKWHGERFADPLEPDYRDDHRVAWANLRSGGKPYIHSHAHGGQRFALVRAASTIKTAAGEMPRLVREADELMRHAGEVYQREGTLVRLVDGGVMPVAGPWLRTHLETIAQWLRFDKRVKDWLVSDAPGDLHSRIMSNVGGWTVPELSSVVRAPLMRPDGSMLETPGYDPATGVLLLAEHPDGWPGVPHNPSREQVKAALRTLWEPFEHFPFVDSISRSINLAACLTAVQRPMLDTAPAFAINSYKAGTGKGKAAKAIGWLSGNEPTESPWSSEPEEQRKRIMAKLMTAPASLLIDNVNGSLESDTLCAVLTSTKYEDRRLGASENITVPTRVLITATGNNIQVAGDLARRVLVGTIDHGIESPERLAFPFDPVARVRERWLYYRAAALTILRGFMAAGKPRNGKGCMGSFEQWDSLIRQCVVWLQAEGLAPFELADPADAVSANYADDPDTMKLRALLAGWRDVIGDRPVKARELVEASYPVSAFSPASENRANLADALNEIAGERGTINPRRLGRWIERHAGRVVDGVRISKDGISGGYARWRVDAIQ